MFTGLNGVMVRVLI